MRRTDQKHLDEKSRRKSRPTKNGTSVMAETPESANTPKSTFLSSRAMNKTMTTRSMLKKKGKESQRESGPSSKYRFFQAENDVETDLVEAAAAKKERNRKKVPESPGDDEVVHSVICCSQEDRDPRMEWVESILKKGVRGIVREFTKGRSYLPSEATTNVYSEHMSKNRYVDVSCADATRIVLKGRRSQDDYIHASWVIPPVTGAQKYICTQGPMDETIVDFWQMMVQEKSTVIVMLCSLCENGYKKCSAYWPAEQGSNKKYGKFSVKNEKVDNIELGNQPMKLTLLNVSTTSREDPSLTVWHYQWNDWPDHVSPMNPAPAVELLKTSKEKAAGAPIVVHCSAGIGRTGTFCGIDFVSEYLRTHRSVGTLQILYELRAQRIHSIQSNPQYLYLHVCLLHWLITRKIIPETRQTRHFFEDYRRFCNSLQEKNRKREANEKKQTENEKPKAKPGKARTKMSTKGK